MSDRDFIIQEIRKLFNEQEVASNPTKPAAANTEKPPKTTEKPKPQSQTGMDHPAWQGKYASGAQSDKLNDLITKPEFALDDETNKRAMEIIKIIYPKAIQLGNNKGLSVFKGTYKGKEIISITQSNYGRQAPIPGTLEVLKYLFRQTNNLPASLGGKSTALQKSKPIQGAQSFMAQYEKLQNKLIPGYSDNNPEHVKKWKNSQQFKTIQNITTGPNKDKDRDVNVKKVIDYINSELSKKPATPASSTEKVEPTATAKPTEDFPFQVANLPDKFPNKIVAGMDRSDPGYNKGGSKAINQAAIGILGSDPKVIYTALINSGVLPANYSPSGKPFSDLPKHIATFQERAINGLLRYQKQMKISAKDADSRLRYEPEVPTPSLRKNLSDKEKSQLAMRPGLAEQQKANVAVDGKIGSRTAKMLLIYAKKDSFDALKKKAGVEPKAKPSPVKDAPAPTSTSSGKTTTTKKKESRCIITIENMEELYIQTVQTCLGLECHLLGTKTKQIGYVDQFARLGEALGSEKGFDISRFKEAKCDLTLTFTNPRFLKDMYQNVTVPSMKKLAKNKKAYKVPSVAPRQTLKFLDKVISSMVVDIYGAYMGGTMAEKVTYNFAFVRMPDKNIPLVYKTVADTDGQLDGFLKAIKHNSWATKPISKVGSSDFAKPANVKPFLNNLELLAKRCDYFLKNGLSNRAVGRMNFIKTSTKNQKELGRARLFVETMATGARQTKQSIMNFMSNPNDDSLNQLALAAGELSNANKRMMGVSEYNISMDSCAELKGPEDEKPLKESNNYIVEQITLRDLEDEDLPIADFGSYDDDKKPRVNREFGFGRKGGTASVGKDKPSKTPGPKGVEGGGTDKSKVGQRGGTKIDRPKKLKNAPAQTGKKPSKDKKDGKSFFDMAMDPSKVVGAAAAMGQATSMVPGQGGKQATGKNKGQQKKQAKGSASKKRGSTKEVDVSDLVLKLNKFFVIKGGNTGARAGVRKINKLLGKEINPKMLSGRDWFVYVPGISFFGVQTSQGSFRDGKRMVSSSKIQVDNTLKQLEKVTGNFGSPKSLVNSFKAILKMRNFADKFFVEDNQKRKIALEQLDGLYVEFHNFYNQSESKPEANQSEIEKAIISGFENFQSDSSDQMLAISDDILNRRGYNIQSDTMVADTPTSIKRQQESKTMNQDEIKKLIKEAFTDKVYGKYPYSHRPGDQQEPAADYTEDWKKFCMEIVRDQTKLKAITLAKILVKDLELFEDVLDLAGQNQSIGSEILRKMEEAKKDML